MNTVRPQHKKCAVPGKVRDDGLLSIPALDKVAGMIHAFTTRQGGLGARNNGIKHPDDWERGGKRVRGL